jgi:host factor-I protein
MTDFNTGYPSIRKIQTYVKEQVVLEVKLLTNDVLAGKLLWQDPHCLCLGDNTGKQTLIARQAIAYIQPQG